MSQCYVLLLIYRSGQAGAKRAIGDLRNSQHVGLGVVNLYGRKHRNYINTCKFRPGFVMQQRTELRTVQNSEYFRWRERPPSILPFCLKDALMCSDHTDVRARASSGTEFPEILKLRGTWYSSDHRKVMQGQDGRKCEIFAQYDSPSPFAHLCLTI
jgi:hypothetical protein